MQQGRERELAPVREGHRASNRAKDEGRERGGGRGRGRKLVCR